MDVLLIDSDAAFAAEVRGALAARGLEAAVFADGEEALAAARVHPPRAVVLALELGDRPSAGFSWCNRFKRDDQLRNVPLVLTSALATAETFEHHKRLKTRADAYLHKPVAPDRLVGELASWLPVDAPPAGSDEALADELIGDDDIEPVETDEVEVAAADDGLEDLFSDLGAPEVLERTVVAFARPEAPPEPLRRADRGGDGLELAELRGRVAELEARLEAQLGELAERERALAALRAERAETEARLRTEKARADAAAAQNRKHEATLEVLRADAAEVPALRERVADLESRNADLGRDLAAVRQEAREIEQELEERATALAAARTESEDRAAQVARLREEWERTAAELEEAAAERERLRAELQEARADADGGRTRLALAKTENAVLRGNHDAVREDLDAARAELESLRETSTFELEALRAELAQAREEVGRASSSQTQELELARVERDDAQGEAERLRAALEAERSRTTRVHEMLAAAQAILAEG